MSQNCLDLCHFINHYAALIFIFVTKKYRDIVLAVMALHFYRVLLFVKDNTKEYALLNI